jgi:predicted MPP superfamily phosphohydrolase
MRRLTELLPDLTYDICVLTGDYRGATFGPFDAALNGLARVRSYLKDPVYGVLGNHDTIRMVPGLEEMGIRMLLNECEPILRGDQAIYLAGIDDAHYYRVDNIEKAASEIPDNGFSILLSHTPEIYRQAAHAGFDLLVSGHTHGGQICLPGPIPNAFSRGEGKLPSEILQAMVKEFYGNNVAFDPERDVLRRWGPEPKPAGIPPEKFDPKSRDPAATNPGGHAPFSGKPPPVTKARKPGWV